MTEYFDWQTNTWVTMPEGEIHRTPTHAYNGWSYYITSQSQNPDAAWEWIKCARQPRDQRDRRRVAGLRLPAVAQLACNQPRGLDRRRLGRDRGTGSTSQTILAATDHPNAVFDPRIPGAARYQETLELYTNQAIAGELQPQDAMDQCVDRVQRHHR